MRRRLLAVALMTTLLLLMAGPAMAAHVHGKILPNGECVLLAAKGGEKHVHLPNAEEHPPNRQHPLHTNVHLGVPGQQARPGTIFVAINDAGQYTGEVGTFCHGTFLNAP